jgi:hypothetical protein
LTGAEEFGALISFAGGLYDKYKHKEEVLQLLKDLSVRAREGYVEISDETFKTLGIQRLATEENVLDFVMRRLRASDSSSVGVVYQTYDKDLNCKYKLHVFSGENIDILSKVRGIEVRRDYFQAPEIFIMRHDKNLENDSLIKAGDMSGRNAEAEKLAKIFRRLGINMTYLRVLEKEPEVLAECKVLSQEGKIEWWLKGKTKEEKDLDIEVEETIRMSARLKISNFKMGKEPHTNLNLER